MSMSAPVQVPASLVEAVRALDAASSLSEILDTLLQSARATAPDAGLVLVSDPAFAGADRILVEAAASGRVSRQSGFLALPLLVAGEAVAVLWARGGRAAADSDEDTRSAALEVLARHAARCLEAVIAHRAALFFSKSFDLSKSLDVPAAKGGDDDQAARRYARLLVSEIKLYHEGTIAEGQQHRDLVSRLGGEIARAQAMYDERVPDKIRRGTDYFRAELVRTLAAGDASLLAAWPARAEGSPMSRHS
jgi:hypothetical protein